MTTIEITPKVSNRTLKHYTHLRAPDHLIRGLTDARALICRRQCSSALSRASTRLFYVSLRILFKISL
jgi:hypothetical protein